MSVSSKVINLIINLKITGMTEGTGKAKDMMGSISAESSDGLLKCDVGSGFTDTMRIDFWLNEYEKIGNIVTIKANEVISNRNNNTKSLFLPIFIEERFDKTEADNLQRVMEQLKAAKQGC